MSLGITTAEASGQAPSHNGTAAKAASLAGAQSCKHAWIRAQALNLSRHVAALREFSREEFGEGPEAPTEGHVIAVNQIIGKLRKELVGSARTMNRLVAGALRTDTRAANKAMLRHKHEAHVQVQHIEKIWNFYFELFGQRQTKFACWLRSTDRIALDCYREAYVGMGKAKSIPAPPPFTYMQTGFGPATYTRLKRLRQLGCELNPFPLIQLPYHRMVNPWTLGAVLHEVSHNLQNDLGLAKIIPQSVGRNLLKAGVPRNVASIWVRWNREAFADLSALLLGGPGVVASLMDVVGRSPEVTYSYSPRGVHPSPYLRVLLSCELLRRMGFPSEADAHARTWTHLYPDPAGAGFPPSLLTTAPKVLPIVVETMSYQKYSELGDKSLSDIFRFAPKEQKIIEEAAGRLAQGTDPGIVPDRFLIGAARFAFDNRLAPPETIKEAFYHGLCRR